MGSDRCVDAVGSGRGRCAPKQPLLGTRGRLTNTSLPLTPYPALLNPTAGRFGWRMSDSPKLNQCKEMMEKWKTQIQDLHPCFRDKFWSKEVPMPYCNSKGFTTAYVGVQVWQFVIAVCLFLFVFIIALSVGLAPKPPVPPPNPFAIISVGASMQARKG